MKPKDLKADSLSIIAKFIKALSQTGNVSHLLSENVIFTAGDQITKGREEVGALLSRLSAGAKKFHFSAPEVFGKVAGMWCSVALEEENNDIKIWVELTVKRGAIHHIQMEWLWDDAQVGAGAGCGIRVITYHRFCQPRAAEQLYQQCLLLKAKFLVLTLNDATLVLQNRIELDKPGIVVTIDDGHQDFYSVAAPVFRKCQIPVICYLVTDFLDGAGWLWFDVVDYVLRRTALEEYRTNIFPSGERLWRLTTEPDRKSCAETIKHALKSVPDQQRKQFIATLPAAARVKLPPIPPPEYAPLQWTEVRELSANGFEFGAHTRTHPILAQVEDNEDLVDEIAGSKLRIEKELDKDIRHFAYPNGRAVDVDERTLNVVQSTGFLTGVTTVQGLNRFDGDLLLLKRIWVEPFQSARVFEKRVVGFQQEPEVYKSAP